MITPIDIRRRAEAHYRQWLAAIAEGKLTYEPLIIRRTGDKKKADERWEGLSDIVNQSKDKIGYGYRIELEAPTPKSKNKQSRLSAIMFDSAADLLQFTEKTVEWEQFKHDCDLIAAIPGLTRWCATHIREVIRYAAVWPRLLAVVHFFRENHHPNLPVRLLPIEGVDTKFIEQHNGVLCQLLDSVLPPGMIYTQYKSLSKRYGLPEQAPLIECAWNDPNLVAQYGGFSRLAFPVDQLIQTPLAASRIIVVENHNSIQQVLQHPFFEGIVVFGGGFGVSLLKECQWLHQKALYYWGDLDAHGLAILSQFRDYFPHTKALLMDEVTFEAYPHAQVTGKTYKGAPPLNLNATELHLFQYLNQMGMRLEQERVVFEANTLVVEQKFDEKPTAQSPA